MAKEEPNQLGKTLWVIADQLRGAMNASTSKLFSMQCVENLGKQST